MGKRRVRGGWLKHAFDPADHIDAESIVWHEEYGRPEDAGYCHAGHDLALVRGEAQRQYDAYRDRQEYRSEQCHAKEARVLAHAHQKAALTCKLAAKTLRESLDSPGTEISTEIGEKYDAGETAQYIGYSAGNAHICSDHSESQQGEFHRRTQKDEDV